MWLAGAGFVLLLGLLSSWSKTGSAAIVLAAVLALGAYYVRALGLEVGLILLLLVANLADHFTFPVGQLNVRAEQMAMAVCIAVLSVRAARDRRAAIFRFNTAEWLILAWLACGLASSLLASPDRRLSMKVLVLTAVCTLGFFVPRRLLAGPQGAERLEAIVRWLLIAFASEAAYGSFAYLLHVFGPTISLGPNPASGHLEAYGTLWEQNVFGAFAAAGAVAWVYIGPNRFRHAWIGLGCCMAGLVDSLTRAAWLASAVLAFLGITLPGLRRRLNLLTVGPGLLAGLLSASAILVVDAIGSYTVAVPGVSPHPRGGFLSAILNMTDFIGRLNQVGSVWSDIRGRDVVVGRGTASFEALHVIGGVPQHIASLPLLVLNDTGVTGLLLVTAFVAMVVAYAVRGMHDPLVVGLAQMSVVIGLANLATQTTELMLNWLLIGILVAAASLASPKPAAARARRQAA